MLSAEPRSDTIARRTRMAPEYPALQFSSPTEIAQVDASAPDTTPTNFTRDSLKYGLMALDTIDFPDMTRDKSWLSASQEPETGPMGMMGPQGISAPMQGPYAPPSPLEQGGGAFDPYAYDQPFRPGGESDPYGQTSEPGGLGRAAGAFGNVLSGPGFVNTAAGIARGFGADVDPYAGTTIHDYLGEQGLPGEIAQRGFDIGGSPAGWVGIGPKALAGIAAGGVLARRGAQAAGAPEWAQTAADLAGSVAGPTALSGVERGVNALSRAAGETSGIRGRVPGMAGIETSPGPAGRAEPLRRARITGGSETPQGLPWGAPEKSNPLAEVAALKAKIAAEGLTPENAAAQDALLTKLSEAFKNDTPTWEQPPPPVPNGSEGQRIGQAITSARQGEIVTDALANARNPNAGFVDDMAARINARNAAPSAATDLLGPPLATETPEIQALAEKFWRADVLDTRLNNRQTGIALSKAQRALVEARTAASKAEPGAAALPDAAARAAERQAQADATALSRSGTADEQMAAQVGESTQTEAQRARAAFDATKAAQTGDAWIDDLPKGDTGGGTVLQGKILPLPPSSIIGGITGGVGGAQVGDTPEERVRNSLIGAAGGAVVGPLVNRGISGIAKGIEARRGPMVNADGSVRTATQNINEILASPLSALSTYDISAPGRQLFRSMLAHPTTIPRVFRAQMSALRSQEVFDASQEALKNRPWAEMRDLMGVEMGEVSENIAKREEMIQSTITERLLPKSKAFNRAYTGAINEQRDFLTKYMLDRIPKELLNDVSEGSEGLARLQQSGRLINASTGRGNLGQAFKDSNVLGQPLFWAIRNRVGNAQVPLSAIFSTSPEVRIEAARQTAALIGFQLALFGAGKATGAWDVETDPRSSDFGMVRVGNRRLDFTAGTRPLVNFIARSGITAANTLYGSKIPNDKTINSPEAEGTPYTKKGIEIVGNYLRGALAPTLGEVWNQVEGKDVVGNKLPDSLPGRLAHAAQGLGVALFLQQLAEEMAYTVPKGYQEGGAQGAAIAGAGSLGAAGLYGQGVGGSYYQPRDATGGGSTARPSRPSRPVRPSRPARPTR